MNKVVRKRAGRSGLLLTAMLSMSIAVDIAFATNERPTDGAVSVLVENDIFTGSDNNYTNGFGISWTSNQTGNYSPDSFVQRWTDFWSFLPGMDNDGNKNYVSWTLGQEMHTPEDITAVQPASDDQPYAGVLYVDSDIQSRSGQWTRAWHLRIGVVGPAAGAGGVQRWVHRNMSADEPRGWSTQLPNEPIVNAGFTGTFRAYERDLTPTLKARLVSVFNVELGNYSTAVSAGGLVEAGKGLSPVLSLNALGQGLNTAMVTDDQTRRNWGWTVFFGLGATLYGHFLPLDGTVFRDSPSVDTTPLVGLGAFGFSVRRKQFSMSLAITRFSETFSTERERLDYGILSFGWYR